MNLHNSANLLFDLYIRVRYLTSRLGMRCCILLFVGEDDGRGGVGNFKGYRGGGNFKGYRGGG